MVMAAMVIVAVVVVVVGGGGGGGGGGVGVGVGAGGCGGGCVFFFSLWWWGGGGGGCCCACCCSAINFEMFSNFLNCFRLQSWSPVLVFIGHTVWKKWYFFKWCWEEYFERNGVERWFKISGLGFLPIFIFTWGLLWHLGLPVSKSVSSGPTQLLSVFHCWRCNLRIWWG